MKNQTKWKPVQGMSAEYYADGDYFEIRGKIPSRMERQKFLEIIFNHLFAHQSVSEIKSAQSKKRILQPEFFFGRKNGIPLMDIPVLRGDKRKGIFSERSKQSA